jgi:MFS transporter, DHA2 family, methylenomycin A resistance protein
VDGQRAHGYSRELRARRVCDEGQTPPDRGGIASGVINAARQAGGVLGVAALGSLVSVSSAFVGGLRAGLLIDGCAFLAGAALVSGLAREPG